MRIDLSQAYHVAQIQWQLTTARFDEWMKNDVFRFKWWFLVVVFAAMVYIWCKKVDKSRLNEILLYTVLITVVTLVLDELGEELSLWDYPVDLIPVFPPLTAIDLSCLPIVYSFIYQYFRPWKSFIAATVLMAAIFCFILEPLFAFSGIYQMLTWKSYYGFPIYALMAIAGKAAVKAIYSVPART